MVKVKITYKGGRSVEFTTKDIFYHTVWGWLREIGYIPEGTNRKRWYPIGGYRDDNNDYRGTEVVITNI